MSGLIIVFLRYKFKIMKKRILSIATIGLLTLSLNLVSVESSAQCSMCRMSAERGGEETQGLNNGILYMLATPYFIVGVIGLVWYRNRRKEDELVG